MSGILSSLPGSSRGFGPLPQLFHVEAVLGILVTPGHQNPGGCTAPALVPELEVFLPVLSVSSQIHVFVLSLSHIQQNPSLRGMQSTREALGAAEELDWGLTLPGGACAWFWGRIRAVSSPQAVKVLQCQELFPLADPVPALLLLPGWVFLPGSVLLLNNSIIWWLQPCRDVVTSWLGCPSAAP